ncbi:alpha/beta fold hydrolase [Streptomyces syringium]|uniref:alpha/beta fold hydrolase n=1 Tax=Streptomyces syringium TaxID=76729 RepID=UPI003AAAFC81
MSRLLTVDQTEVARDVIVVTEALGDGPTHDHQPDRTEELARLPVPKMVISGSPDATWDPAQLSDMAERLSAVLLPIPGGGHSPNVHRAGEVAAGLLAFWNGRT